MLRWICHSHCPKFGARDYSVMRSYIHNAFKLAWIMSLLLAVITSLLCGFILHTMRTPDIIYDGAYAYLLATFIGIPATFSITCSLALSAPWATAKHPLVLAAGLGSQHRPRPAVHSHLSMGRNRSSRCHSTFASCQRHTLLHVHAAEIRYSAINSC